MFTGIVTDIGRVVAIERQADTLYTVATHFDMETVALGASIACSGVCLTVIERTGGPEGRFVVSVSAETLSKTTLGTWREGTRINLERALRLGDELGGHLVSGHVDGIAEVVSRRVEGGSLRLGFRVPTPLARFVAPKGSVALDGVSLTVNEVAGATFGINLIPHTQDATTLGSLQPGDGVNLEVDMLARYVARLAETA
ncbi:riboflavin synthase [Arenibaculum pallidiluteum]|uniref:riboflavin synthase n=1 Tax=Arenibaculum pallidiluteum TaxID=2812559 RepID=UPI001A95734E|nr:riboflavin synthase [Arenibaculum pallidiluteum]